MSEEEDPFIKKLKVIKANLDSVGMMLVLVLLFQFLSCVFHK